MRQLLPHPTEVDPLDVYAAVARPAQPDRPWVTGLMVASADGAAAVGGRSGALGGPGDRAVFHAVRAGADAIVVGAGTVRAEGYGPVTTPEAHRPGRVERGQSLHPRLVVVSGRLDLAPTLRTFADADGTAPPPLVIHPPTAASGPRRALSEVAELVEVAGDGGRGIDPRALLAVLADRGLRHVVCEGGPSLNGTLLAADLLDEMCLTLDPAVVGGSASRIVVAPGPGRMSAWRPAHLLELDGVLFWRLLRDRRSNDTST